jgi:hypothetical protein
MQCAEFESRLNDVLDQRRWLDADPRLAEHVRRCSECRNLAAAYEAVVVGLEQSRIPQLSLDLTERVLADCSAAAGSQPQPPLTPAGRLEQPAAPRTNRSWALAALAAAVLLAVALRWAVGLAQKLPGQELPAHGDRAVAADVKTTGDSLAERDSLPFEIREAPIAPDPQSIRNDDSVGGYGGLAAETSQTFAVALQLFPGIGGDRNEDEHATNEPASDWMHGLSDGLKPVTRPTAGAVNTFLHLLASGDEGARS